MNEMKTSEVTPKAEVPRDMAILYSRW